MTATSKQFASWDSARQQQYRTSHSDKALVWHFLLDESPSMAGQDAVNLMRAFNLYLAWLQAHADPMSLAEIRCFSTALTAGRVLPLGTVPPLTTTTYNPLDGDGTALYHAIGTVCQAQIATPGQHVLVVFTDGLDNRSAALGWTATAVEQLLTPYQQVEGWLCVFLGAMPEALTIGQAMGFAAGNCLEFTSDQIPDAFKRLRQATQKYLMAGPAERKLLTAGGVF